MRSSTFRLLIIAMALVAVAGIFASLGVLDGEDVKTPSNNSGNSSNTETTAQCEHDYTQRVVSESTCTDSGLISLKCKNCNFEGFIQTEAKGHRFEEDNASCLNCDYVCNHSNVAVDKTDTIYECFYDLTCKDCGCYGFRINDHVAWDDEARSCNACGYSFVSGDVWIDNQ